VSPTTTMRFLRSMAVHRSTLCTPNKPTTCTGGLRVDG
jgi:hypothetical protein